MGVMQNSEAKKTLDEQVTTGHQELISPENNLVKENVGDQTIGKDVFQALGSEEIESEKRKLQTEYEVS